jgi:hypothetical protein
MKDQLNGLFDFDWAISLKSGMRLLFCGCSGIVGTSAPPACHAYEVWLTDRGFRNPHHSARRIGV